MRSPIKSLGRSHILFLSLGIVLFSLSIFRIHLRLQTTLLGYEIGRIKQKEIFLRDRQSELKMLHAKVSSLKHLNLMSQIRDEDQTLSGQVALK